jgi:hypothetical protein
MRGVVSTVLAAAALAQPAAAKSALSANAIEHIVYRCRIISVTRPPYRARV